MTKRRVATYSLWTVAILALGLIAYSAFGGTYDFRLTQAEIQERINAQLPKTTRDITVDRADVTLTDALRIDFSASGQKRVPLVGRFMGKSGVQAFTLSASVVGTPRYDMRRGAFFLDPQSVEITNFERVENDPGALRRFVGRVVKNEKWRANIDELAKEWGPDFREWLVQRAQAAAVAGLERFPVYTLKSDTKGLVAKTFLDSVEVKEGMLVVKFTLWHLTKLMLLYAFALLLAIGFLFALAQSPGWGTAAIVGMSILPGS